MLRPVSDIARYSHSGGSPMSRSSLVKRLSFAAIAILVVATVYVSNLPSSLAQHDTIVLGESRFPPGGQAALRALVEKIEGLAVDG